MDRMLEAEPMAGRQRRREQDMGGRVEVGRKQMEDVRPHDGRNGCPHVGT